MLRVELPGVELTVAPGDCLALVGPSGAGKTTLLRTVAGLHRPAEGRIACDGDTWLDAGRGVHIAPERRRCGVVFQDYALFGHLGARANVAYGIRTRDRDARAQSWLERLGVGELGDRRPAQLSGGERQRVALARALAPEPRALLLDEPLSALDPGTRGDATAILRDALSATGVPSLLVTHDFAEAALLAQRVAVLDGGRVAQQGTAGELAAAPVSAAVAALTGAVVLPGTARRGADGLTAVDLDGGATIHSADAREGAVAATLYPWEIALEPAGAPRGDSARNRLPVTVAAVTPFGNRARVALTLENGRTLVAEVTAQAAAELDLEGGKTAIAAFKATATRLVAR